MRSLSLVLLAGCAEARVPTPIVDASAIDASTVSAVVDASTIEASAIDASVVDAAVAEPFDASSKCVLAIDFGYVTDKYAGSVLVMRLVGPSIREEIFRDAGPVSCSTSGSDTLTWQCSSDMGPVYGTVSVEGSSIVFRENHSSFGPGPKAAPVESKRKPFTCADKPKFRPKNFSNTPH